MPVRAPKPCSKPGCAALVPGGQRFCTDHQRKAWATQAQVRKANPERHALDQQYRSQRWRKYAQHFLRNHPLCAECERNGTLSAAELVDHVVPVADGGDFWDESNHEAMCDRHHRQKSARETFGSARG